MQIETAFQENQLQMLKINDNFTKLQSILGDDCDFEPIDLESMFEFTSSILEDIQNKMLIQRSKSSRVEKESYNTFQTQEGASVNTPDASEALKSSSPDKSSEIKDNYNTSDFKSNKEATDEKETYEVINAKKYHKEMEYNQFDSVRDSNITSKLNTSPVSNKNYKTQPKSQNKEQLNKIPKHPIPTQNKPKRITGIPGVKKPNSVSRTKNIIRKEETKKHKGKTPSFGNTNAPLFLNNFQVDGEDSLPPELRTPENLHEEELKTDRRSLNKNQTSDLTDKFKAPILSHRDTRKAGSRKPIRAGQRNRNSLNKASPLGNKFNKGIGISTPKPLNYGKLLEDFLLIKF